MATRKQEKKHIAKLDLHIIKEKARKRMIGQRMKDSGYTSMIHNNKDKISYTKREQKQIKKLENIIRK